MKLGAATIGVIVIGVLLYLGVKHVISDYKVTRRKTSEALKALEEEKKKD